MKDLITFLGNEFYKLIRINDNSWVAVGKYITKEPGKYPVKHIVEEQGITPEEALTNLQNKLNDAKDNDIKPVS